jgi:hypothetical protein
VPAFGQRRPRRADPHGNGDIPLVRLKWQCANCCSVLGRHGRDRLAFGLPGVAAVAAETLV